MNQLKRLSRFRYLRSRVRKDWAKENRLTAREKHVLEIIKASLADKDNIQHVAPITGLKFIKMPEKHMFVIIEGPKIIISDHKFYYDIQVSGWLQEKINRMFDKIMDHQRMLMEKELMLTVTDGLGRIAEFVKQK
jgi:hypothetical protein